MNQPLSIKIFLAKGSASSLRTAEISNWSGKAITTILRFGISEMTCLYISGNFSVGSASRAGYAVKLCPGNAFLSDSSSAKTFSANDPYGMSSASSVCNFNGQIIVTAPNVIVPDPS